MALPFFFSLRKFTLTRLVSSILKLLKYIISHSNELFFLILISRDSLLVCSFDDLLHCVGVQSRENSPEEVSRRKIFVIIVRKVVLEFREPVKSFHIDDTQAQFIIFRHICLLNILDFQSLSVNLRNLLPYLLREFPSSNEWVCKDSLEGRITLENECKLTMISKNIVQVLFTLKFRRELWCSNIHKLDSSFHF